ncbi:MAG TPA: hypothetical protein VFU46_13980, partial [Gemmatimonadales bacterium]|nr:hypothetical protein [Gemmatimonadales bacterium]
AVETPVGLDAPPLAEAAGEQPLEAPRGFGLEAAAEPAAEPAASGGGDEPEETPVPAAWVAPVEDEAAGPGGAALFPDLSDTLRTEAEPVPAAEPGASEAETTEFAAPPLPEIDSFRFERAEEIVLNVSTASEFQAPSAAEDLLSTRGAGTVEPEPALQAAPPSADDLFRAYITPPEPSASAAAPMPEAEAAPEPVAAPAPEPAAVVPPVLADTDAPATAEPELVVTETMAEVFLRQGHVAEALLVYRELVNRAPAPQLHARIAELEARQAAAASPPRPSYAARDTGGQSLGSFFQALLAARPGDRPQEATDVLASAVELSPETAPATRPAEEPLSLGSVFGEDPPAVAPAVPPAGAAEPAPPPAGETVSFDDFFAGAKVDTPPPAQPARPARGKPDDDLDQFHAWLQGLKR